MPDGMPGGGFGGMPGGFSLEACLVVVVAVPVHSTSQPEVVQEASASRIPTDIFAQFAEVVLAAAGGGGGAGGGEDAEDIFNLFSGLGGGARGAGSRRGTGNFARHARPQTPEVTVIERPLPVTLEELYKGAHKKMKIKRKTFNPQGSG
ncbi:DnaJ domain protein [Aspergillus sclerotialis]|uniref:DnaJ domain protein n=1 Tax=Aspergillus sclerotialis TaxID=2070753 RepID=A0A3A2Z5F0_9EURO|nr:DnaJ domain protein [Aspergillus sclerotialis]